jgi:mitochondrial import inner membrane translocase subunit TIM17
MCDERPLYDEIPEYRRRLIDYVGDSFFIAGAAGSGFHFVKGLLNSPNGSRLAGGASAARTNALRVAGNCGVYAGVLCSFKRAIYLARRREDHWNLIAAGAASSGVFSIRMGALAAARSALLGATMFAGVAAFYWAAESWESRLRSCRESRLASDGNNGSRKCKRCFSCSFFLRITQITLYFSTCIVVLCTYQRCDLWLACIFLC